MRLVSTGATEEDLETFVHFKLTARPEAFKEVIDHMKYFSVISVQENDAENVTED